MDPAHRQRGLGEELEKIGARRLEFDVDHLRRDRVHLVDRAEQRLQRVAAGGGDHRMETADDLGGVDRARAGGRQVWQAEDQAAAIVGDDPARRHPRHDLAAGVEADEALPGRLDQCRGGRVERPCGWDPGGCCPAAARSR